MYYWNFCKLDAFLREKEIEEDLLVKNKQKFYDYAIRIKLIKNLILR